MKAWPSLLRDRLAAVAAPAFMVVFIALAAVGSDWGLPGADRERFLAPAEARAVIARAADLLGEDVDAKRARGGVSPLPFDPADREAILARIYRRYLLYSHHPDEGRVFIAFAAMDPRRFDFNPHTFQNGGLFYYPLGVWYALGHALGVCSLFSDVNVYLDRPEEMGRLIRWGRLFVAVGGALAIPPLWRLGTLLWGGGWAACLCLLWTFHPFVAIWSHVLKPYAATAAPVAFMLFHLVRWRRGGPRRDLWIAAACAGLAPALSVAAAPVVAFPLFAALAAGGGLAARLARAAVSAAIAAAAYLLFNPYLLVSPGLLAQELSVNTTLYRAGPLPDDALRLFVLSHLPRVVSPLVIPLALLGIVRWRRAPWGVMLLAPSAMVFGAYPLLAGPYVDLVIHMRILLPFLPLALLWGTEGMRGLFARARLAGVLAAVATVATLGGTTHAVVQRYRSDNGETSTRLAASAWIVAHLPPGSVEVATAAAPWDLPPLPFARHAVGPFAVGSPHQAPTTGRPYLVLARVTERTRPPAGYRLVREWGPPPHPFARLVPEGMIYAQSRVGLYAAPEGR